MLFRQFIPENNVPLGIAATADRVFLTTPRWTVGVPFSLSSLNLPASKPDTPLRPYPNWSAHSTTNNVDCKKMMSVYRVHVDECNRLWAIDAGLIDTVTNAKRLCPPKLLVFDLATDKQLFQYVFPEAQVKQDSLYTNVVVEIHNGQCDKAVAYVADVWRNQLLVYDMGKQAAWLTANYLYNSNPHASNFTYQGFNFQWSDGIFGLALSKPTENPDDRVLYFHPMSSLNVSSDH